MKIVINNCFGGFSLSSLAIKKYLERKNLECYFYDHKYVDGKSVNVLVSTEEAMSMSYLLTYTSPDPDDKFYFYNRDIPRDDPDLIAVVEELGDKADGPCAQLRIVEIPDGVQWEISEYDGNEHVAESHRTWY